MSERHRRSDYRWFTTITTRWMDNDVYHHINNVQYYSFFDTAVGAFSLERGMLDIGKSPVIGLVVETGCRYFAPISFPDIVYVGLRVAKIGNSSVRYEIGIFRNDEEDASAQGFFVHVYVDEKIRKPLTIPDDIREAMKTISVE
jgi:acyl-CoA thioester hydrolase